MEEISWNDFTKVDIRIGKIIDVRDFPEAIKPAYILTIDFGRLGTRKTSAQVTNYTQTELLDRDVVAVYNFPPKQIGKHISEVLVLGFPDSNNEPISQWAYGSVRLVKMNNDSAVFSPDLEETEHLTIFDKDAARYLLSLSEKKTNSSTC